MTYDRKPNVPWFRQEGPAPIITTIRDGRKALMDAGKPSSLKDWHIAYDACRHCHGRGLYPVYRTIRSVDPMRWDDCAVCKGTGLYAPEQYPANDGDYYDRLFDDWKHSRYA